MKIDSCPMTAVQIAEEITVIAQILSANGIEDVIISNGWGAGSSVDELWKPIHVKTSELPVFLNSSIGNGVFRPGNSDLFIEDEAKSFQFFLCHESDIHLKTYNPRLIEQTAEHWAERGYCKRGNNGSA
jgi:hypothetical protein